jgi:hypothetical protein
MGELTGGDAQHAINRNCSALTEHWATSTGQWTVDHNTNIIPPDGTGGLFGSAIIIGVAEGIEFSYDATAIINFTTETIHSNPLNYGFGLASGHNVTTLITTEQGPIITTWDSTIDAVSALMMQSEIYNDYVINDSIGAQSEWINSYPTKHYYVDPVFSQSATSKAPFSHMIKTNVGACEPLKFVAFNRDQQIDYIFPPAKNNLSSNTQSDGANHCWSVNVAEANNGENTNTIFNSILLMQDWNLTLVDNDNHHSIYNLTQLNGGMQINFKESIDDSSKLIGRGSNGKTHTIYGKPVLGFVSQKYVNGTLSDNILANYGIVNTNKNLKNITVED